MITLKLYPRVLALIFAPATLAAASADAAAADTYVLPEMTVSGDWLGPPTKESVRRYAGAREVVSEQDLHETGSRTVEDALRLVPGVRTQDETGTGTLPNIGIRGLNPARSEQALILVDGIPATLAPYGQTGMSLFPLTMQSVERVDVVRGGAAVHYGPNNVGGVINFVTKPIPSEFGGSAREQLTLSDNGQVLTDTYARVGGYVTDDFGWQLHANLIDGESFREHSETRVSSLMLDADWLLGAGAQIKGRLQYYDADTELPGALSPEAYEQDQKQSTRPHDYFVGDTVRGDVTFKKLFEDDSEFSWTSFAHDSSREFGFGSPLDSADATAVMTSPREFWVYGTEPRYTANFDGGVPHKVMVGARYVREEVDFIVDRTDLSSGITTVPRDWRFENDAYSFYVSDTLSLLDNRLKVTPGVRYESLSSSFRNNADGATEANRTTDSLPGLDVGYEVSPSAFVFANYHQSLRPVQFVHVVRGGDLSSERAENYEAGFRLFPNDQVTWSTTAFRLDFEDKIEYDAAAEQFRNLGEARHQGIENSLSWRPASMDGLELRGTYTYLDTEQLSGTYQGNELPFASRHQYTAMAQFESGSLSWNLNGSYFSSAFSDSANTTEENASGSVGEIPAYWLWNAQLTKKFRWQGTPMKAGLGLNNLFDEDYYFRGVDYSVGRMPAPGRAFLLSVEAQF